MPARSISLSLLIAFSLVGCLTSMPQSSPAKQSSPSAPSSAKVEPFVWPHGTRAAVSLTYDDAIQSQLDNAVPALAKHGLVATFFLTGTSAVLSASPDRYRDLVKAGHELGSHTMYHPCDRSFSWVAPGHALQEYDAAKMDAELDESIQQLRDLGQTGPLSFAYPCGSTWLGEQHASYVPSIEKRFVAGRGVNNRVTDPSRDSLSEVPSAPGDTDGATLTSWVERALESGGWIVFTFHGVAGDYLDVKEGAHETLLTYLEQHKTTVWTERFGSIAQYIKAQTHP